MEEGKKLLASQIEALPRFESKYFNCVRSQAFSYLKFRGLPMEVLLFNSYESTEKLFQQYVVEQRRKWEYGTECMDKAFLTLLGIEMWERWYDNFDDAEADILNILERGEIAIVASDLFYLPHRGSYYQNQHIDHFIILTEALESDGTKKYRILDDNSSALGDYICYEYDRELIATAFNSATKNVITFHYPKQFEGNSREIALTQFRQWLSQFRDDLKFYDWICETVKEAVQNLASKDAEFEQIINALTLVAGSRAIYAFFCQFVGMDASVVENLQECAKQADIVKNMLVRSRITKKLDTELLASRVQQLKERESVSLAKFHSYAEEGASHV
jgi:hypothetical protein